MYMSSKQLLGIAIFAVLMIFNLLIIFPIQKKVPLWILWLIGQPIGKLLYLLSTLAVSTYSPLVSLSLIVTYVIVDFDLHLAKKIKLDISQSET